MKLGRKQKTQASTPSDPRTRSTPSRVGSVWLASILFALVLLLLLIFILQNSQKAEISFFGAHGDVSMGVALLLAAVFGILLVALPGSARIMQLRMRDRRRRKLDQTQAVSEPPAGAPAVNPAVDGQRAGWAPGARQGATPGSSTVPPSAGQAQSADQPPPAGPEPNEANRTR